MHGKVLDFNAVDGRGLISGMDGQRYTFTLAAMSGTPRPIRTGQDVDFEAVGTEATSVYLLGTSSGQVGTKSKVAAGLLAIFLGWLGVHKFYIGATGGGVIMLLVWLFGWILFGIPSFVIWVISVIEGIVYLSKSDEEFYEQYEVGKKAWF